jgi:ribonuclease HII
MPPSWDVLTIFEDVFWQQGLLVAGTDEVGRGPLAGPVVAAAVVLDPARPIEGLDDSKKLSVSRRLELFELIEADAWAIGVGAAGPRTIERINIFQAARLAMRRAIHRLPGQPDVVLSDAMPIPGSRHHTVALIRGDQRSASIAAASIVAKVVRDRYMEALAEQYPGYGFEEHRGYPTPRHRQAILALGASRAHRTTFLNKVTPTTR